MDIQINGAYGFDFSVYDGDDENYKAGLKMVAEKIVETGVTSYVSGGYLSRCDRRDAQFPLFTGLYQLSSYVTLSFVAPSISDPHNLAQTQEKSLYPKILSLLHPYTPPPPPSGPGGATLLGWHAEGPFLQLAKRGAHAPPFLLSAPDKMVSFERVYGERNLAVQEDWAMQVHGDAASAGAGVRIITAAPELEGVMDVVSELTKRGVVFSIGHRYALCSCTGWCSGADVCAASPRQ